MSDWKNYVGYLKLKKQGDKYRISEIKKAVFN